MLPGLNTAASILCCDAWGAVLPPGARGVKGAALAAWVEKVDFLVDCSVDGVNDGDSTFRVFLPDLGKKRYMVSDGVNSH